MMDSRSNGDVVLLDDLGLNPDTKHVLRAAGFQKAEQLRCPADVLLTLPHLTGTMLCEIVHQLGSIGMALPSRANGAAADHNCLADESDLEMLQLRVVQGLSLADIAHAHQLTADEVKRRLHLRFGLIRKPPAVNERRNTRKQQRLERSIALRVSRRTGGIPFTQLVEDVAMRPPAQGEVRQIIGFLASKGLVKIDDGLVVPSTALVDIAGYAVTNNRRRSRGTCSGQTEQK
jgi:hypothetical protein